MKAPVDYQRALRAARDISTRTRKQQAQRRCMARIKAWLAAENAPAQSN